MQIRKNTKAFKTIVHIMEACKDRPDRSKLVRLFITKVGQTIHDRIYVEGIQSNADLFYEMNYQAIVNNLSSSGHQLWVSDEVPGIYFLRGSNKAWDETPFEFAEAVAREFAALPELPMVRKKEAPQKYVLPVSQPRSAPTGTGKKQLAKQKEKPAGPALTLPSFNLRHTIDFTNLDRVVYTQRKLNKGDVLNYYHKMADYLLPWLKDRALWVRPQSGTETNSFALTSDLLSSDQPIPEWVQQRGKSKERQVLLCNDREHLFFYLERGFLEFSSSLSRLKSIQTPDYIVLTLDSPDLSKTVEVTRATGEVLAGLLLPSFIKTDGQAGFHLYIPLDTKSDFEKSGLAAEYLCKLVRLKIPALVTLNAADEMTHGKVSLNYGLNAEDKSAIAPYSLVPGSLPTVATPLEWDEVQHDIRIEDFNIDSIFKRLKETGDPFETFFKKKVNAGNLLQQMEDHYAFLV
jgi:DNA ligase D-like protein (predicted polymerase)